MVIVRRTENPRVGGSIPMQSAERQTTVDFLEVTPKAALMG
jgi:hypothetical protein